MKLGIEIFVHGKPSEAELVCLGSISEGLEEQVYKEFFGSSLKPTVSPCYVYEIRKWKGSLYSVFSLYTDGKDSFGSGNGYCVISILVKSCYTENLAAVNNLLKELYRKLIINKVLDDSYNYKAKTINGHINLQDFQTLAENALEYVTFLPIDNFTQFGRPTGKPICLNPEDASFSSVYNYIEEQGRVYVSAKYPSIQQIETDKRKREADALKERMAAQATPQIQENQIRNSTKSESESLKEIKNLSQKIDLILRRLPAEKAGNFPEVHSQTGDHPDNSFNTSIKGASLFNWITVVNCILLLLCLFRCNSGSHNAFEGDYNPIEVTDSVSANVIDNGAELADKGVNTEANYKELEAVLSFLKQYSSIKIDVSDISNGKIKINTPYTLSLKSEGKSVNCNIGHFESTPGTEITKNETGDYVLRGLEVGKTEISYIIGNQVIQQRTITITQ